jgi:hypothetical protein
MSGQLPFARYLIETVLATLDPSTRRLLDFLAIWRGMLDLNQPQLAELQREKTKATIIAKRFAQVQRSRLIDCFSMPRPPHVARSVGR